MREMLFVLLVSSLLLFGCVSQEAPKNGNAANTTSTTSEGVGLKAEKGDAVAVDYLGTLDDGKVFDTSIKEEAEKAKLPLRPSYEPLEFTVGAGQMIKGFDDAVVGMALGEEKTVHIAAADAYGEVREDRVVNVSRANMPADAKVGSSLQTNTGMAGTVIFMDNETARIDFNHPLAGKALNFKIIMRKVTKK